MSTMRRIGKRIDLSALLLILSVSAVVAYGYFNRVDRPHFESRLALHSQIVNGTATSPYRYRILVPLAAEALVKAWSVVLSIRTSFLLSYAIYDLLAIFFLLAMLFSWLKTWFSREQALVGVLFVAATMPIALQDHYFQPWSLLEAGIFTAALTAIYWKRYWLLALLVVLASLNRETAIFIPMALLLAISMSIFAREVSDSRWTSILSCGGVFLLWAVIFWGLRSFLGSATHIETVEGLLARNTTKHSLLLTVVNGSLFLGGIWLFALLGFRYAPPFVRRMAALIPIYLMTVAVWGVWYEVRLLMPLYPVLVPLGLSFLFLREHEPVSA